MKRLLLTIAAMLLALALLPGGAAADDPDGVGGPVILMGLDSEWDPSDDTHGTRAEHAAMAQSLLDAVRNDGEGILVLGGDGTGNVGEYWNNVGEDIGEDVTFVKGAAEIEEADFQGHAIIGVASTNSIVFGGLTPEENDALIGRSSDIANFVNEGGGLLGKTQQGFADPFGYMGPFGTFEVAPDDFSSIVVTPAGLDLGLTQEGMDGWCCWHEVFTEFPDFLEVLVTHDEGGTYQGEAAALGGLDVVIPTEISLAPTTAELETGQTHTVTATVLEDEEPLEGTEVTFTVIDGPHEGETGAADTDADGQATFSYTGTSEGTDQIQATFVDGEDTTRTSNTVTATWTAPEVVEECVDLIASQSMDVGEVCVSNDDTYLYVTYTTDGDWTLLETHLAVSTYAPGGGEWTDNRWQNRPGNPAPGRFPNTATHDPDSDVTYTYSISLEELGAEPGDELHIGAHAVVTDEYDEEAEEWITETAWGDGDRFVTRGNWAMHFTYEVQ